MAKYLFLLPLEGRDIASVVRANPGDSPHNVLSNRGGKSQGYVKTLLGLKRKLKQAGAHPACVWEYGKYGSCKLTGLHELDLI